MSTPRIAALVALASLPLGALIVLNTVVSAVEVTYSATSHEGWAKDVGVFNSSFEQNPETGFESRGVGSMTVGYTDTGDQFGCSGEIKNATAPFWKISWQIRVWAEATTDGHEPDPDTGYRGYAHVGVGRIYFPLGVPQTYKNDAFEVEIVAENDGPEYNQVDFEDDAVRADHAKMNYWFFASFTGELSAGRPEMDVEVTGGTSDGNGFAEAYHTVGSVEVQFAEFPLE